MNSATYRPQKKQKMSLTQTYFLAHTARGKLSKEASRSDHNLRLLVGHANLLDSLMLDLSHAEQEQEQWFNQTVTSATKSTEELRHVQWADTVLEEAEEDWDQAEAESSDDDSEDEEITVSTASSKHFSSPTTVTTREISEDDFEDDEADYEELALTRTSSRHPPELTSDSEDDSEDESMPPSPPSQALKFTEEQRKAIATTSYYDRTSPESLTHAEQASFVEDGYYLPSRQQPTMIAAF